MCGILFSLANKDRPVDQTEWNILKELNDRRGMWRLIYGL